MREKPQLQLLATAYRTDQLRTLRGPVVLFLGRSNVGKSSLLNALSGKRMAQVSKSPGKTRSVNYFQYGKKLNWVDLPGYGYAKRSKVERDHWAQLMKAFFETLPAGALGFLLMDCKRDLETQEEELIEALLEHGHQVQILMTKCDRLSQSDRKGRTGWMDNWVDQRNLESILNWGFVSVKSREGLEEIRRLIYHYEKDHSL